MYWKIFQKLVHSVEDLLNIAIGRALFRIGLALSFGRRSRRASRGLFGRLVQAQTALGLAHTTRFALGQAVQAGHALLRTVGDDSQRGASLQREGNTIFNTIRPKHTYNQNLASEGTPRYNELILNFRLCGSPHREHPL